MNQRLTPMRGDITPKTVFDVCKNTRQIPPQCGQCGPVGITYLHALSRIAGGLSAVHNLPQCGHLYFFPSTSIVAMLTSCRTTAFRAARNSSRLMRGVLSRTDTAIYRSARSGCAYRSLLFCVSLVFPSSCADRESSIAERMLFFFQPSMGEQALHLLSRLRRKTLAPGAEFSSHQLQCYFSWVQIHFFSIVHRIPPPNAAEKFVKLGEQNAKRKKERIKCCILL